jgi:hypothetical protein
MRCHSVRTALFSVPAAVLLMSSNDVAAQPKKPDAAALKQARIVATATFLDRAQPKDKRLAAAKHLGFPDEKTMTALLKIAADKTENQEIRAAALGRHPYNEKYLDAVLKILTDPKDAGEELNARLIEDLARRTTFARIPSDRKRVQTVLRKLLGDPRDKVRLQVYRTLVSMHDTEAINRLSQSLKKPKEVPVPLAEAIELLDLDGSIYHIVVLRPYLNHADPHIQGLAARSLAVDAKSRPKIVELAKNRKTPNAVRLPAIGALARTDEQFAQYALVLLENAKEDLKVRYALMDAFVGRMNYHKVAPAQQVRFAVAVEKLAADKSLTTDDGRKTRAAAQQLLVYLQQAFPEVKKHYEKR